MKKKYIYAIFIIIFYLLSVIILLKNNERINKEEGLYSIPVLNTNPSSKDKSVSDLISDPNFKSALEKELYSYDKEMNMSSSSVWYKPLEGISYDIGFNNSLEEQKKINDPSFFNNLKKEIDKDKKSKNLYEVSNNLSKYYNIGYNDGFFYNKKNKHMNQLELKDINFLFSENKLVSIMFKKAIKISYNCYGNLDCYNNGVKNLNFNQKIFMLIFINLNNEQKDSKIDQSVIESRTNEMMFNYLNNDESKKLMILTGFMEGYTRSNS